MIMALTAKGVSRQEAHEQIRVLSHQTSLVVKVEGGQNDLLDRIRRTSFFQPIIEELDKILDPKTFIGRAPQQVEDYIEGRLGLYSEEQRQELSAEVLEELNDGEVDTILRKYKNGSEKMKAAELHC